MADPIVKLHKVTVGGTVDGGGKFYYCLLNPKTYTGIGSTVGITLASEEEQNSVRASVAELLRAGIVFRLNVTSRTTPKRYFNILCTRDKVNTALDGLAGKTVNGVVVGAARAKRTANFYS